MKKKKVIDLLVHSKDSPFAILKDRSSQLGANPNDLLNSSNKIRKQGFVNKSIEKMKNKFIYLGKFYNCEFIQKIPIKKTESTTTTNISYSSYKRMKQFSDKLPPLKVPMD